MRQHSEAPEASRRPAHAALKRTLCCVALRPYVYHELPFWGRLYGRFVAGMERNRLWSGTAPRIIRGKLHGYEMELNLASWSERTTFFLGRYYDLGGQLLLRAALAPGDRFIDIGANIGMLTLLASHLVGGDGRVDAVEPNPDCAARIRSALSRNSIGHVTVHNVAAGSQAATATLSVPEWNSGEGSLLPMESQHGKGVRSVPIQVVAAQSIVDVDAKAPVAIKIDVEGFEMSVLEGLRTTLMSSKPLIITEVVEEHLRRAGSSPADMFAFLQGLGYLPFGISTQRSGMRHHLRLERCEASDHPNNVAWISPGSVAAGRLRHYID